MGKQTTISCHHCKTKLTVETSEFMSQTTSTKCLKCNKVLLPFKSKALKSLSPNAYIHPLDKSTLEALQKVPGVNTLLKTLVKHSFELSMRLHHQATNLRVSDSQYPTLYKIFLRAKKRLDITQKVELFVYTDPRPNAYTYGVDSAFIAISSGALDLLNLDEILCVLGHELGHVQANHVLYKTASRLFGSLASSVAQVTFGLGRLVIFPIQAALTKWDQASEFSGDRAAMLVAPSPQVAISALMKLAGGSEKFQKELNLEAFIAQANDFDAMQTEGPLGKYMTLLGTLFQTHPYPIWRTKELLKFMSSQEYMDILQGHYEKLSLAKPQKCEHCGKNIPLETFICSHCGEMPDEDTSEEPPKAKEDPMETLGNTINQVQSFIKSKWSL